MTRTLLLVLLVSSCSAAPSLADPSRDAGLATITTDEIRSHVETLASDEYEGREPSTFGEKRTVAYLVREFRDAGLAPAVGGSYVQRVRLLSQWLKDSSRLDVFGPGRSKLRWKLGRDLLLDIAGEASEVSLSGLGAAFVGHGIIAPERGWDDYAGLDVTGRVVFVLKEEPGSEDEPELFDGRVPTYYSTLSYKKEEASRRGAVAILFVHRDGVSRFPWSALEGRVRKERLSVPAGPNPPPSVALSGAVREEAVREALAMGGHDYDELVAAAGRPGFRGQLLNVTLKASVKAKRSESVSANVIGRIEGSQRPDEHVIYTAHWDHLGVGEAVEGDAIYNGAVDNATGTAALLEIAQAFGSLPEPPRRSVVFIATTAEEKGLLGSRYYVNHPVVPLADTMGVINMDALFPFGVQNGMTVTGRGQSELESYLDAAARAEGREPQADPSPEAGAFFRSDHHPFVKKGVPALFAVGGPLPEPPPSEELIARYQDFMTRRYHKPADELHDDWDFAGILQDTRIFFRTGLALAQDARVPNWSLGSEYRARRDRMRAARVSSAEASAR